MEDLRQLWNRIGDLALTGVLLLPQTRSMTATLAVVASRRRYNKNNTYVADELGTSRRVVRETDDLATLRASLVAVERNEGVRADAPDWSIALPPRHQLVLATVFGGDNCEHVVTEQPEPEQPEPEQPEPEQRWCSTRRTKKPVACSDCDWTGGRVNVGTKPCPRCGGVVVLRDARTRSRSYRTRGPGVSDESLEHRGLVWRNADLEIAPATRVPTQPGNRHAHHAVLGGLHHHLSDAVINRPVGEHAHQDRGDPIAKHVRSAVDVPGAVAPARRRNDLRSSSHSISITLLILVSIRGTQNDLVALIRFSSIGSEDILQCPVSEGALSAILPIAWSRF